MVAPEALHQARVEWISGKPRCSDDNNNAKEKPVIPGYRVGALLGEGAFGRVYLGQCEKDKLRVAIKREVVNDQRMKDEADFLRALEGVPGVPKLHLFKEDVGGSTLIMDLLGLSLDDLHQSCCARLSAKTVIMLADQMIVRLQDLHNWNIIHRDVKPDNFLMGRGAKAGIVHVIDFGLAKYYRNLQTLEHDAFSDQKRLTGTPKFCSIRAHTCEQSRRDDLEALGYSLVYLVTGSLPWDVQTAEDAISSEILKIKEKVPLSQLCSECPPEFQDYLKYCRKLCFEAAPDYVYLQLLLQSAMSNLGSEYDGVFDWMSPGQRHHDESDEESINGDDYSS